jgi:F-type H+-transporting ATPase subunit a
MKRLAIGILVLLVVAAIAIGPFSPRRISIQIKPEPIFEVGGFTITNTLLSGWLAVLFLIGMARLCTRHLVDTPAPLSLQNIMEAVFEALRGFMERFVGARAKDFFPVVATFFLFILTSNWLGLLPGFGSIGFWQLDEGDRVFVPLLRGSTTDLNTTIALAVCSVLSSQVYGVRFLGFREHALHYVGVRKFIAFFRLLVERRELKPSLLAGGMLDLFLGFLAILEELTKILSFSFRLFGNVFAGEVLLAVVAFLAPYVASVPFLALELLTGFIQAIIFASLSTAFLGRATSGRATSGRAT